MKSRTQSKLKFRLTIQTIGTLEKRTIINITTAANIEIKITTITATALISLYIINHITLYMTKKATNRGTTPKKNKKNLKLNSGLPTETNLVNLTTDLINDLINILWTIKTMILT
jgi:hypothetical protein